MLKGLKGWRCRQQKNRPGTSTELALTNSPKLALTNFALIGSFFALMQNASARPGWLEGCGRVLLPFALLFSLAQAQSPAPAPVFRPRFPAEMHGFNSLGTWPQLLAKGTTWFKVDFGLATEASCKAFSTFGQPGRGNVSDCFQQGGASYCCLAMSGDTGSRPNLLDPFNTSYDLVSLLDDPAMQALLPHGSAAPFPQLLVALDFGGSPSACLSGCPAAALTRSLLLSAAAAIARRNLSITFALDSGIGSWYAELDGACAAGCSAADQALAALPFIAQGGAPWSPPGGAAGKRYRILNEDYDSFQRCCASNCWSAATPATSEFPWNWYEQTGQEDYLNLLSWWSGCANLPPGRRADPNTQLNFVSNEAPEMAEVFAAPSGLLGRGLNAPIAASSGLTTPFTLAVPLLGGGAERALVLAAALPSSGGLGVWSLPQSGGGAPGALEAALDSATLASLVAPPVAFSAAAVAGVDAAAAAPAAPQLLLLGLEDGTLASGALDPATGAFLPFSACSASGGWCVWQLALEPGATLLSSALLCTTPASTPLPPHASALNATCTVAALVALPHGGAELRLQALGSPTSASSTAAAPVALAVDKGGSLALTWAGEGGGSSSNSSSSTWEGMAVLASRAPPPRHCLQQQPLLQWRRSSLAGLGHRLPWVAVCPPGGTARAPTSTLWQ